MINFWHGNWSKLAPAVNESARICILKLKHDAEYYSNLVLKTNLNPKMKIKGKEPEIIGSFCFFSIYNYTSDQILSDESPCCLGPMLWFDSVKKYPNPDQND